MNWFERILRPRDDDQATRERAEEADDVGALMDMAYDAAASGDYATAIGVWRPLADSGWPRAQSNLGACYSEGLGVERDLDRAAHWFQLAVASGDPVGQRNLATLHFKGEGGVAQDDSAAVALFRQAAEQGDAAAQDMLSWMLLEGQGSEADPVEARRWALAAAEQGVATSMTRLGLIAHNALGMERDPVEAARWWYEASRRGEPDGQAMLGAALHLGGGVERNDPSALVWLLRAEAGGSALAASFLASVRNALSPEDERAAEAAARRPLAEEDET